MCPFVFRLCADLPFFVSFLLHPFFVYSPLSDHFGLLVFTSSFHTLFISLFFPLFLLFWIYFWTLCVNLLCTLLCAFSVPPLFRFCTALSVLLSPFLIWLFVLICFHMFASPISFTHFLGLLNIVKVNNIHHIKIIHIENDWRCEIGFLHILAEQIPSIKSLKMSPAISNSFGWLTIPWRSLRVSQLELASSGLHLWWMISFVWEMHDNLTIQFLDTICVHAWSSSEYCDFYDSSECRKNGKTVIFHEN